MFCDNCGKKINNDSTHCDQCGHKINLGGEVAKKVQQIIFQSIKHKFNLLLAKHNPYIIGLGLIFVLIVIGIVSASFFSQNTTPTASTDAKIAALENQISSLKAAGSNTKDTSAADARIQSLQSQLNALKSSSQIAQSQNKLSTSDIVSKVRPAIVMIRTDIGCGTGMIVRANGTILTDDHVVNGATYISVYLNDGSNYSGSIINENYGLDLALVKIYKTNLSTVSFGDSSDFGTPLGTDVVALGFPLTCNTDQTLEIDAGNITARRSVSDLTDFGASVGPLLQTSARINPGDSGGPLVNSNGNVIGINEKISSIRGLNLAGFAFAIPSNIAKPYINNPGYYSSAQTNTNQSAPPAPSYSGGNSQEYTITGIGFCDNNPGVSSIMVGDHPIQSNNIIYWSDTEVRFSLPSSVPRGQYTVSVTGYKDGFGYCPGVPAGSLTIY